MAGGRVRYFEAWIESIPGFLPCYRLPLQFRINLLVFDITTGTPSLETNGDS